MADSEESTPRAILDRLQALLARIQELKVARVLQHYAARRGPILAAGLSYQAIFSVFAAVWASFSIMGIVLVANPALREGLFNVIAISIPRLFDRGNGGAIDPDELLANSTLGWTGALALLAAIVTAIGWLGSAREAVRDIAELAAPPVNFFLLRARDLLLALLFGVAVVISAAFSVGSTAALTWVLTGIGVDEDSMGIAIAARGVGLFVAFALDVAVLVGLYRVLAGVPIPPRPLWTGAFLGAAALGVLKALASILLPITSSNPLLASFTVIVGLLIWFNLICQVILIGAAWVVVGATDAGVPLDPVGERRRREAEARLRLEIEEEVRAEVEKHLPRAVRWLVRRNRDSNGSSRR